MFSKQCERSLEYHSYRSKKEPLQVLLNVKNSTSTAGTFSRVDAKKYVFFVFESEKSSFTSLNTEVVSGTSGIHVFGHLLQR